MIGLEWKDVDVEKRQLCVARSEWCGHVSVPKGGRIRYLPLTRRLAGALKSARHLRGPRVLCDETGKPLTRKMIQVLMRRSVRRANVKAGVTSCATRSVHTWRCAGAGDPDARRSPGSRDDAAVYAPESGGTRCGHPVAGRRGDAWRNRGGAERERPSAEICDASERSERATRSERARSGERERV